MIRDSAFDLAPVVLRELATTPYYSVVESLVPPGVVIPPPQKSGGGGAPWRRVEPLPRPRPALHFRHVAEGGVGVGGTAADIYKNGVHLGRRWQNEADENFLLFGLFDC